MTRLRIVHVTVFALVACGGAIDSSDAGPDGASGLDAKAFEDASDPTEGSAAGWLTLHGTTVVSPGGSPLGQITVCVWDDADIPCVMSDASGAFSLGLPTHAELALMFAGAGYATVLVPLVTGAADFTYAIGLPTTAARASMYAAFGATYPDATNGFVMLEGTLQGQKELGLDGATGSLSPKSGSGPFYLDASGNPAPSATSTSTNSQIFFAAVAPDTYLGELAPSTLSCTENFGGWATQQPGATKFPVAAGFETHVGLACTK